MTTIYIFLVKTKECCSFMDDLKLKYAVPLIERGILTKIKLITKAEKKKFKSRKINRFPVIIYRGFTGCGFNTCETTLHEILDTIALPQKEMMQPNKSNCGTPNIGSGTDFDRYCQDVMAENDDEAEKDKIDNDLRAGMDKMSKRRRNISNPNLGQPGQGHLTPKTFTPTPARHQSGPPAFLTGNKPAYVPDMYEEPEQLQLTPEEELRKYQMNEISMN